MGQKNLVSASISTADMTAIKGALTTVNQKLSFLISLTEKDRKGGIKMGDKTIAFVEKAFDYANKNANLLPNFVSLPEWSKDVQLCKDLGEVVRLIEPLTRNIEDTLMEAGTESLACSLTFYNAAKQATKDKVPGAKAIYEDLQKRFPGRTKAGVDSANIPKK